MERGPSLPAKSRTNSNPPDQPAGHIAVNLRLPEGWIVTKDHTVEILQITPGQAVSIDWRVQVPLSPKPGKYQLTAIADYRQGGAGTNHRG